MTQYVTENQVLIKCENCNKGFFPLEVHRDDKGPHVTCTFCKSTQNLDTFIYDGLSVMCGECRHCNVIDQGLVFCHECGGTTAMILLDD